MIEKYIPWIISGFSLLIAFLTFQRNASWKDDAELKDLQQTLLQASMKLDQVCSTTNETRCDIKAMQRHIAEVDTELAVVKRDLKTAFTLIDQIKGESK